MPAGGVVPPTPDKGSGGHLQVSGSTKAQSMRYVKGHLTGARPTVTRVVPLRPASLPRAGSVLSWAATLPSSATSLVVLNFGHSLKEDLKT